MTSSVVQARRGCAVVDDRQQAVAEFDPHRVKRERLGDRFLRGGGRCLGARLVEAAEDILDHQAVLGDGEGVVAGGLAIPARHTGKAVGDIAEFDIERRRVEKIEPPAR